MKTKKVSTCRQYFVANGLYANEHKGNTVPAKDSRGDDKLWMELRSPYLLGTGKHTNKAEVYIDPFFLRNMIQPSHTGRGYLKWST